VQATDPYNMYYYRYYIEPKSPEIQEFKKKNAYRLWVMPRRSHGSVPLPAFG
jgi:hypothetical protein